MFHTLITLAYIIPNIYVFLRIRHLFINRGYRIHYTIIYLLFALIYPASNLFHETENGFPAGIITLSANYILPFYLYLFLLILLFDLILFGNFLFRIFPLEKIRNTRFKILSLCSVIFLSAVVVAIGVINFNTIRVSDYSIDIPAKSSGISNLKIAFAADFHLKTGTSISFVEKFAAKINEIKPDILLFGGDIVEGDKQDENMIVFEKILSNIKTRYGVYGVLGNHEYYGGEDKGSFFDKAGIKVLCDTIIVIDNSFNLGGRYDSHFKSRKPIDEFLKALSGTLPMILIDHRPTEIDQVSNTPVNIQLSGHTHNGQLFPINLITKKIYQLSWGHIKKGNTDFFVTSGIRLWGPPVRTAGKSEIMVTFKRINNKK
jgi:predicted MPP superfamily phosphohydrolase